MVSNQGIPGRSVRKRLRREQTGTSPILTEHKAGGDTPASAVSHRVTASERQRVGPSFGAAL
jgi:hypothetical protein